MKIKPIHIGVWLDPVKGWQFRMPDEEDNGQEEDKPDEWRDCSDEEE